MSHRIPPALVVSFEEWEESTDLLEDLEIKTEMSVWLSEEDARLHCISVSMQSGKCYLNTGTH